jgi:CheY-like chemotaxis protein
MTTTVKRILLVEDNQKDIDLTLAALEENHLADEVIVVRDGQQALDYLYRRGNFRLRAGGHPAVVLLDLKLPKISGLEVLSEVKADRDLKSIPVVMLTSSREEIDLSRSYQRGVNAYVVKPVTFARFVEALRELGVFWAEINEPPPGSVARKTGLPL